jgi:hypothetical protein
MTGQKPQVAKQTLRLDLLDDKKQGVFHRGVTFYNLAVAARATS